jgi:diguanylate cyclase (GGDEF)-like protein/PAS domain S-box-containing protein
VGIRLQKSDEQEFRPKDADMRERTLKKKMEWFTSVILFVAISGIAIIVSVITYRDLEIRYLADADNRLEAAGTLLSANVEQVLKTVVVMNEQIQTFDRLQTRYEIDQLDHHLEVLQKTVDVITTLYVGTEDGAFYLYPKNFVPDDYDPRERDWYKNALKDKASLVWQQPYTDVGTNELVITASHYFETASGNQAGVIGVDLQLTDINTMLRNTRIGESGYVFIGSEESEKIIASPLPNENGFDLKAIYGKGVVDFMHGMDSTYEDASHIYIKRDASISDLVLFAAIAKADLQSLLMRLVLSIAFYAAMVFIISTIFVHKLAQYITKPILKLCGVMERVGEGDYYVQYDIESKDEVGTLVTGFNDMLRNIKEKNEEMTALYEELYASEEALQSQYDELYKNREMIRYNEERYRLVFDITKEGLWEIDADHRVQYITHTWYSRFGIDPTRGSLDDWLRLVHPDDRRGVHERLLQSLLDQTVEYRDEYRVMDTDASYRWIEAVGKARFNADGTYEGLLGSHMDSTKRKNYENRILEMAYIDSLTQLYNRTYIAEKLQDLLYQWQSGMFIFIDLDRFKHINDTYGHAAGDQVLIKLAERLRFAETRLLARFSGDEFLLVLPMVAHETELKSLLTEILLLINQPIYFENKTYRTTASIGVSVFPKDSMQVEELIRRCDIGMYFSKKQNGNTYSVYDAEVEDQALKEIQIESSLKYAVENDELYLRFQPIVDIKRNRLFGFEALLRWRSPLLGEVYPDTFIPIAEKTGLINEIGLYVLKEACRAIHKLSTAHQTPYHIAVNISVIQLMDDRFVHNVLAIIEESGYKRDLIEIEITESVMLESSEEILAKLYYLKSKGVKISLDDFGTGYSSINNLLKLPLSYLKIDKQVVRDSVENDPVFSLLESVVTFAHKMNIAVIAEGIETQGDLNKVEALDTDYAQGYFFGKPLLLEELDALIEAFEMKKATSN